MPTPVGVQMKTLPLVSRRVQLAFATALLTSLVVGAVSYRLMAVSRESDLWLRHTHEVLETLQELLFTTESIDSSYRGFALTGHDSYLETYHASVRKEQRAEAAIHTLTADNPEQKRQLPALARLVMEKIELGEQVIALRRSRGLPAAADAVQSGPGPRIELEFQEVVRNLQGEELRLLALRDAEVTRRLGQTKIGLLVGIVLGLLIALAAGWPRPSSAQPRTASGTSSPRARPCSIP